MAIRTETAAFPAPAPEKIPPLVNGDRLTRPEFERRFDATPNLKVAELIDGRVYIPDIGRARDHAFPCFDMIGWLGLFHAAVPAVKGAAHGSVRLDWDNMLQPDALLMISPDCGGQARVDEDDYISGPPELVVEVAATSASYDLHDKLNVYRRSGVREYIVWRVLDQAIDWFVNREGCYEPLPRDEAGLYKSEIFPGLWLDPAALVRGDLAGAVRALQQGLTSPEHAAFVARLQQAKE